MTQNILNLLVKFIKRKGHNQKTFSEFIGVNRSTLNNAINRKNNFQVELLLKANAKFPDFLDMVIIPAFSPEGYISESSTKDRLIELLERENNRLLEDNEKLKNKIKRLKKGLQTNVEPTIEQSF
uniref:hypothetical protein n=1 Tax=Ornithobacterium rhinotracheale TaxID=28251 RepID=UPI0039A51863